MNQVLAIAQLLILCMLSFANSCFVKIAIARPSACNMVDTGKGKVSQALFDFALLVDKHVKREPEWVKQCLAAFANNGYTEKHDLIGVRGEDYEDTLTEFGFTPLQKSRLRRCIARCNDSLVEAFAERGAAAPARDEASAIKTLVDAIKADEVDVLLSFILYCVASLFNLR